MKGIITEFNQTGNSTIDLSLVCKKWDNRFSISVYGDEVEQKYALTATRKGGNARLIKTQISKQQALEIIDALKLVNVKSAIFQKASTYISKDLARSEFSRLTKIANEKRDELDFINRSAREYFRAIADPMFLTNQPQP